MHRDFRNERSARIERLQGEHEHKRLSSRHCWCCISHAKRIYAVAQVNIEFDYDESSSAIVVPHRIPSHLLDICSHVFSVFRNGVEQKLPTMPEPRTIDKSKTMAKIIIENCLRCCTLLRCKMASNSLRESFLRSTIGRLLFGWQNKWTIDDVLCSTCVDYFLFGKVECVVVCARSERLHASGNEDLWDAVESNHHHVCRSIDKWFFSSARPLFVDASLRVPVRAFSFFGYLRNVRIFHQRWTPSTRCRLQAQAPNAIP